MTQIINQDISNIMYTIKPRKKYKGYNQAMAVLKICCSDSRAMDSLDREVYPLVAMQFDCNPKTIEKNIRMFLDNIDYAKLSALLDVDITEPLEVKEFIYMVVAYIENKYLLHMN